MSKSIMLPGTTPEAVSGAILPAHTPGPWCVSTDREGRDIIGGVRVVATAGNMGCSTGYPETERRPHVRQAQADARLIAAAPDLLEAAQAMVRMYEGNSAPGDLTPITSARAAIAKALGPSAQDTSDPQATPGKPNETNTTDQKETG